MEAKIQIRALATALGTLIGLTAITIGQILAVAPTSDARTAFVVMAGLSGALFAVREVTK